MNIYLTSTRKYKKAFLNNDFSLHIRELKVHFIEMTFFLLKGVLACSFALSLFAILAISKKIDLTFIARYDFILIMALGIQVLLILTKQETLTELKIVCIFHLLGLALEAFKTLPTIGSWTYPEFAYIKIFNVPLYCGFMYASVASFIIQFWHKASIKLINYNYPRITMLLAILIYLNFFTHHFIGDYRWILALILSVYLYHAKIEITCYRSTYKLPLVFCFALAGFVVWLGENIATFYGAWQYPNQNSGWVMVHMGKIGSWGLLVVVTFVIIAYYNRVVISDKPSM